MKITPESDSVMPISIFSDSDFFFCPIFLGYFQWCLHQSNTLWKTIEIVFKVQVFSKKVAGNIPGERLDAPGNLDKIIKIRSLPAATGDLTGLH